MADAELPKDLPKPSVEAKNELAKLLQFTFEPVTLSCNFSTIESLHEKDTFASGTWEHEIRTNRSAVVYQVQENGIVAHSAAGFNGQTGWVFDATLPSEPGSVRVAKRGELRPKFPREIGNLLLPASFFMPVYGVTIHEVVRWRSTQVSLCDLPDLDSTTEVAGCYYFWLEQDDHGTKRQSDWLGRVAFNQQRQLIRYTAYREQSRPGRLRVNDREYGLYSATEYSDFITLDNNSFPTSGKFLLHFASHQAREAGSIDYIIDDSSIRTDGIANEDFEINSPLLIGKPYPHKYFDVLLHEELPIVRVNPEIPSPTTTITDQKLVEALKQSEIVQLFNLDPNALNALVTGASSNQCAASAIFTMACLMHKEQPLTTIKDLLRCEELFISLEYLMLTLEEIGISTHPCGVKSDHLRSVPAPAIVHLTYGGIGHYIVYAGFDGHRYLFLDEGGVDALTRDEVITKWEDGIRLLSIGTLNKKTQRVLGLVISLGAAFGLGAAAWKSIRRRKAV